MSDHEHDDETFENVDAGASLTFPMSAGSLKKGGFVCIKGFPCKISEITTSKTGKHGHAKANITAIDIFTGKKYEEVAPTSHSLPVPNVKTSQFDLLDIATQPDDNDKYPLSLMDDEGETREDLNLPDDEELAAKIKEAFEAGKTVQLQVTSAMETERVMGLKVTD